MHLFYGSNRLRDDLLRFAVQCQLHEEEGGLNGPCIMVDSNNIVRTDRLTDIAFELSIEPEAAMDNIFISRAFNHSQTYDLVVNQLEDLFWQVPAKLLITPFLPDLYHKEGLTLRE
jgi:DNA repair protein RadA